MSIIFSKHIYIWGSQGKLPIKRHFAALSRMAIYVFSQDGNKISYSSSAFLVDYVFNTYGNLWQCMSSAKKAIKSHIHLPHFWWMLFSTLMPIFGNLCLHQRRQKFSDSFSAFLVDFVFNTYGIVFIQNEKAHQWQ